MFHQPFACRAVRLDRTRRADVISGDRIAEDRERLGTEDIRNRRGCHRHAVEIRRVRNISAARAPLISVRPFDLNGLPMPVAFIDVSIARDEHGPINIGVHGGADFGVRRPKVFQIDVMAVGCLPDWRGREVLRHRALQRIGHHQRRRREEVRANVGRNAAFEIAIARQDRGGNDVVVVDSLADRFGERAAVADAGRAAIADEIEADRVEMRLQPGLDQIISDHL